MLELAANDAGAGPYAQEAICRLNWRFASSFARI